VTVDKILFQRTNWENSKTSNDKQQNSATRMYSVWFWSEMWLLRYGLCFSFVFAFPNEIGPSLSQDVSQLDEWVYKKRRYVMTTTFDGRSNGGGSVCIQCIVIEIMRVFWGYIFFVIKMSYFSQDFQYLFSGSFFFSTESTSNNGMFWYLHLISKMMALAWFLCSGCSLR